MLATLPLLILALVSAGFAQAPIKVTWEADRLTVIAEGAPLSQILKEVARQTGMELRGLRVQKPVSVHLVNVPLSEGLENLLCDVNYAIMERPSHPGGPRRACLVVFGQRVTPEPHGIATRKANKTNTNEPIEPENESAFQEEVIPDDVAAIEGEAQAGEDNQPKKIAAVLNAAARQDQQALRKAVLDPDAMVQGMALEALAREDRQGAIDTLLSAAKSDQPDQRLEALQRLGESRLADPATLLPLFREAVDDPDPAIKSYAIQALAALGGAEAMGYLRQALRDQDPSIRLMIIEQVSPKDDGLGLLQDALSDPDESVRTFAASKLQIQTVLEGR